MIDFWINCGIDETIPVHRNVVAATSYFFDNMMRRPEVNPSQLTNVLIPPDIVRGSIVRRIMDLIYIGTANIERRVKTADM